MSKRRPQLNKEICSKDFKDFYWLKSELTEFCREIGIPVSGGKIEISKRILAYLETGKIIRKVISRKVKLPKANNPITNKTLIGIEYRTYKEKKEFLKSAIGNKFHFTTHLLDYFKINTGKKTYGDLIEEWYKEQELKRDPNYVKEIAPQFEYNTYIRDFMKDNPGSTRNEAIEFWKIKKSIPGDNVYRKSDLEKT